MLITNAVLSFYCACTLCCGVKPEVKTASGVSPKAGITVATGQREIPLGSNFVWSGKTYIIQDRMHKRYDATNIYHFDIFVNDHKLALKLGRLKKQTVTIKTK